MQRNDQSSHAWSNALPVPGVPSFTTHVLPAPPSRVQGSKPRVTHADHVPVASYGGAIDAVAHRRTPGEYQR